MKSQSIIIKITIRRFTNKTNKPLVDNVLNFQCN